MENQLNQFSRSILYYPTIQIPPNPWLKKAVLYWDQIGSIVPRDEEGTILLQLSKEINYLLDEELFQPYDPMDLMHSWETFEDFSNELQARIDSEQFRKLLNKQKELIFDYEVHRDKVSDTTLGFLLNKSLVHVENPDRPWQGGAWICFERTTAYLYMALLAKYLARIDRQRVITIPGTDFPYYQTQPFSPLYEEEEELAVNLHLKDWLPEPIPETPIQDIVAFKRKYGDELIGFQIQIFELISKIQAAESTRQVKEIVDIYCRRRQKGETDLEKALASSRIETSLGSVSTLIGIGLPQILGPLAEGLVDVIGVHPDAGKTAAILASGAIAVTYYYVGRQNLRNELLRKSPYSFLYHAREEAILPKRHSQR